MKKRSDPSQPKYSHDVVMGDLIRLSILFAIANFSKELKRRAADGHRFEFETRADFDKWAFDMLYRELPNAEWRNRFGQAAELLKVEILAALDTPRADNIRSLYIRKSIDQ